MSTLDTKTLVAIAAGGVIGAVTTLAATHYILASNATSSACTRGSRPGALNCVLRCFQRNASDQSSPPAHEDAQPYSTSARNADASGGADAPTMARFEDDEILKEQFTRNVQFFGQDGQSRVTQSFVVVIGLGVRHASSTPLLFPYQQLLVINQYLSLLMFNDVYSLRCKPSP